MSTTMRALGFCVSVEHARFMARQFERARDYGSCGVGRLEPRASADRRCATLPTATCARAVHRRPLQRRDRRAERRHAAAAATDRERRRCSCSSSAEACAEPPARRNAPSSTSSALHRTEFRFDLRLPGTPGRQPTRPRSSRSSGTSRSSRPAATSSSIRSPGTSCSRASGTRSRHAGPSASRNCARSATSSLPTFLDHSGLELEDVYANNRSWSELRRAAGMPDRGRRRQRDGTASSSRPSAACRRRRTASPRYRASRTATTPLSSSALDEREPPPPSDVSRIDVHGTQPSTTSRQRSRGCWAHPQVCAELVELFVELDAQVDHVSADRCRPRGCPAPSACPLHTDRNPGRVQ